MSKKRIILFAVLGCLLLSAVLSLFGVIPNKYTVTHKVESKDPYRGKSYTELQETAGEGTQVSQYIRDFNLPRYDETGKEVFTIVGKEAFLVNDSVYKINRPEIHLKGSAMDFGSSDEDEEEETEASAEDTDDSEAQDMVITAKKGEMDRLSNKGVLTGNVVVRLGNNTTLKTEYLIYYPDEKKAITDHPVAIQSEKMNVTGVGMEAEMGSGRMWIEKSVVAEIKGSQSGAFMVSFGKGEKEKKEAPKRIYIRCNGKMVFEKEPNMVTFHDNVRVRKGDSTMTSDKLIIIFGKDADKPKMIVGEGNVTASDGVKVAKGDFLVWDAVTDATTLKGTPTASFFEKKMSIISPKLLFYQAEDKVIAPKGGQLITKGFDDKDDKDGMLGSGSVTITWKGRMNFEKAKRRAVFEDDVHLTRRDFKLNSEKLIIGFDQEEGRKVSSMRATGGVYIVEKNEDNLREVYGEEAVWEKDTGVIEVLGEGTLYIQGKGGAGNKGMTNISWGRKMVRDEANKKISFFENVLALKGNEQVECNQLNAFLGEDGSKVRRVVALGDVVYNDTKEDGIEGLGDVLEWDWKQSKMILSGTPTAEIRRHGVKTFAKRVYYDPKSQRLSWREKPHWQIPLGGRDAGVNVPITLY